MTPDSIIEIPGTGLFVLKDDKRLTPWALANKSIKGQMDLATLKEVQALPAGSVILDVGAFVGDTALMFHDMGHKVFAFEAREDAFECLKRNCPGAVCYLGPVGNGELVSSTVEEIGGDFGTRAGRVVYRDDLLLGVTPSTRIDGLSMPHVDLIKIDIEGHELFALRGMAETIRKSRPYVLIEMFDHMLSRNGHFRSDIFRFFWELDYGFRVAIGMEGDKRTDYMFIPFEKMGFEGHASMSSNGCQWKKL